MNNYVSKESLDLIINELKKTKGPFWGLLAILQSLGEPVLSSVVYEIDSDRISKIKSFLTEIFYFGYDQPSVTNIESSYAIFSNCWTQEFKKSLFEKETRVNFYLIALWAFRNYPLPSDCNFEKLKDLFLKRFNISDQISAEFLSAFDMSIPSGTAFFSTTKPSIEEMLEEVRKISGDKTDRRTFSTGKFVESSPWELTRAPFVQPLYAGQSVQKCILFSGIALNEFYSFFEGRGTTTKIASAIYAAGCLSPYLAAIRTKPFILLAGISGTGKSRMVCQLARGCCPRFRSGTDEDHPLYDEQKPGNFEMIPVRPNWHDSTELMGYVSRISGSPKYVITDFIRFLAKAWLYEKEGIPFFLCLDEMNLAPVEQYFAEFLSVIETRKKDGDRIVTDTLVKISDEPLLKAVIDDVYKDVEHNTAEKFKVFFVSKGGLPIPSNLVVMGTVNMDETTCTFSRKVLDRAMSFELNDVSDMYDLSNIDGEGDYEFGSINSAAAKQSLTTGKEACDTAKDICGKVLGYLKAVNEKLDKTAFKIAYRSRNEIMIYCFERINGDVVSLAEALDEVTSMKILSRIEGDSQHVTEKWLGELSELISAELAKIDGYDESKCNICRDKLNDMKEQVRSGYTSFWMC